MEAVAETNFGEQREWFRSGNMSFVDQCRVGHQVNRRHARKLDKVNILHPLPEDFPEKDDLEKEFSETLDKALLYAGHLFSMVCKSKDLAASCDYVAAATIDDAAWADAPAPDHPDLEEEVWHIGDEAAACGDAFVMIEAPGDPDPRAHMEGDMRDSDVLMQREDRRRLEATLGFPVEEDGPPQQLLKAPLPSAASPPSKKAADQSAVPSATDAPKYKDLSLNEMWWGLFRWVANVRPELPRFLIEYAPVHDTIHREQAVASLQRPSAKGGKTPVSHNKWNHIQQCMRQQTEELSQRQCAKQSRWSQWYAAVEDIVKKWLASNSDPNIVNQLQIPDWFRPCSVHPAWEKKVSNLQLQLVVATSEKSDSLRLAMVLDVGSFSLARRRGSAGAKCKHLASIPCSAKQTACVRLQPLAYDIMADGTLKLTATFTDGMYVIDSARVLIEFPYVTYSPKVSGNSIFKCNKEVSHQLRNMFLDPNLDRLTADVERSPPYPPTLKINNYSQNLVVSRPIHQRS
jgi:hypothetical protein